MASNADNNTSLEVMRKANEDFIELISNLKTMLTGTSPVTFNMDNYTITVDSIVGLINNYKQGKFTVLVIGGQSTNGYQVKLSVDSQGRLKVTDNQGNLATLDCSTLEGAYINKSTVNTVEAKDCTISKLVGSVSVTGGTVSLDKLNIQKDLSTSTIRATDIYTDTLDVSGSVTCNSLLVYGTRKLNVPSVRDVFYRNGSPIDNEVQVLKIDTNGNWQISDNIGSPRDFGYGISTMVNTGAALPGMLHIRGNNAYTQFYASDVNSFIKGYSTVKNIKALVSVNGNSYTPCDLDANLYFAVMTMWPTGIISETDGTVYLTSFNNSDLGKDIYYHTEASPWVIYRSMTVTKTSAGYSKVTFGDVYSLPAYSCIRFIADRHVVSSSANGNEMTVVYALEIA